ncbi:MULTISPECIES: hypothetical protein [Ralstonia]|jgi:hypothetical protein|uniref:Uncharacterized protein n=1 Tax=Ralstonia pickettii OR214 TaxID=1264675 RepID=R0E7S6_RALPI|nr:MULTISPECIES: hypothetical protein [Ralstonia]ENZ77477.1 hypothetical protein OR214_02478 [Ralstonia pickettii OR214]MBL4778922.1 hypothetical protein [Ralstonia sp.]MCM3579593.1 hypothetical protein [Ralstonia pickettii]MDR9386251.1 hypothetical protein [Ralstonia sp. 11b]OYU21924.1 MAG: hypothetical protein CFE42_16700 [Ralstonia sp. PBBBR1]
MGITRSYPVRFTPKGLCDALDATDAFPGACVLLRNLVFDQGNPELVVPRPGVGAALTTFSGFTSPTFVSVFIVLGNIVYGMVSSGRTAGFDEPFAYNVASNSFVTISGVTAGNVPSSPATSGPWTPPTMAVIGTKIIVTHPGFSGSGSNFFGVIDISNPATPAWSSSNTATNGLPGVPTAVANFNNRAYFAIGNVAYFSDVLAATTRTNASQSVTLGDTTPIIGFSGLPTQTTSGGVVAALIAFKAFQIWQVTGDTATSNLAVNYLSLTTGTSAARSITQSPMGTYFAGSDAPYVINPLGAVQQIVNDGKSTSDVQTPFLNTTQPSRMAGAYSGSVYRVCVPTLLSGQNQTNDYWFDLRRRRWNGPHSFVYDCAGQYGAGFILSGAGAGAALFFSSPVATSSSTYLDAGASYMCQVRSSTFPKNNEMLQLQVVESNIELSSPSGSPITFNLTALNEKNSTLASTSLQKVGTFFQKSSALCGFRSSRGQRDKRKGA